MARKSNNSTLGFFIVIAVFGMVSNFISKHEGILPVIILVVIALIAITVVFISIKNNRTDKKITQAFTDDSNHFISTIEPHLKTLSRKRNFLITNDDYGYSDDAKWITEKENFLKKINYQPKTTDIYNGLQKNNMLKYIDDAVDIYQEENQDKISYSNELTPFEYEQYCAYVLNQHGWVARTTRGSGDQGVDVIAKQDEFTVAIQCKKYSSPISNGAVQEVMSGMHYWGANIAAVVTNTSYTKSARELAKSVGVLLIHHDDLPTLIDKLK